MAYSCPTCGKRAFPDRGRGARFQFIDDPDTGKAVAVIMRFGCGHDAWMSKELREKYGGKESDPTLPSSASLQSPNKKETET